MAHRDGLIVRASSDAPLLARLTIDDLIRAGGLRRFDDEALGCLRHAQTRAGRLGHDAVDSGDLLVAVLDDPAGLAGTVIRALDADPSDVRAALDADPSDVRAALDQEPGDDRPAAPAQILALAGRPGRDPA